MRFTSSLSWIFFRLIDNLPAATRKKHKETNNVVVYQGYRLGGTMNDQVYINNYLKLKLSYHKHGELVSIPYKRDWGNCDQNYHFVPLFAEMNLE